MIMCRTLSKEEILEVAAKSCPLEPYKIDPITFASLLFAKSQIQQPVTRDTQKESNGS